VEAKNTLVTTHTSEPVQPTRLYWKVANLAKVRRAFASLNCIWRDAERAGGWMWMYSDEATSIGLAKRPDEVPEEFRPIALSSISFPRPGTMMMRFRSPDRALAAAKFFAPRLGTSAIPDRIRILNRLVTLEDAGENGPFVDKLLDQNVTFIDPEATLAKTEKALAAVKTRAEKLQVMEREHTERLARDVPEVEDLPLAMEEETEEFTHLTITLRVRCIRAFEHWSGKPTKLSEVILRVFQLPHPATGVVP
jgi:hypothetical protein